MRIDHYQWADEDPDLVLTAAVIPGVTIAEAVQLHGGDPAQLVSKPSAEAWPAPTPDGGQTFTVQFIELGTAVVAIEPGGWTGSIPEIARRGSRNGRYVAAYWSMSGAYRITEAEQGGVTAYFDPFAVGEPGGMGDRQPAWAADLALDIEQPNASCLAALEVRSDVAFQQEWLTSPQPTCQVPGPDRLLAGVDQAWTP
ncbi:hypothetical protein [Labedaea rhizosphaerae]|uniref:Uncharacterized protein n=1 Tax=Labedaea rhizosphaerae TaxID=598644 RepID=A0A4R6S478_LABRH|nr:hypothetical protein [Labedaea rhizosphaerae]TDP94034.1 hypothetical protein EV186_106428 [Labedaea rhizosphaerae]